MPDWLLPVLALVLPSSVLAAALTALVTYRVGMRTATAAAVSADAAHATAMVAGRTAAIAESAELRQHMQAMLAAVTADNATLRSDLAALHASYHADIAEVLGELSVSRIQLAECEALNRAISGRMTELETESAQRDRRLSSVEHQVNSGGAGRISGETRG